MNCNAYPIIIIIMIIIIIIIIITIIIIIIMVKNRCDEVIEMATFDRVDETCNVTNVFQSRQFVVVVVGRHCHARP